jgi:hypothetical protein
MTLELASPESEMAVASNARRKIGDARITIT